MRKALLAFICLTLVFISCSQDEMKNEVTPNFIPEYTAIPGVKTIDEVETQTRGVAQSSKVWNKKAIITIKFLNGSQTNQNLVKDYASKWLEYADIRFQYVATGNADVRITFSGTDLIDKYVSWSYTGNDCKRIEDQSKPTANLAFFEYGTPESQKADVLRLFGQILGLELEHRHLKATPNWTPNVKAIENYWIGNITDIPWGELQKYVFDPLDNPSTIMQTKEVDPSSIMVWEFPRNISMSPMFWRQNYDLSVQDIEFIKYIYGADGESELTIDGPSKVYTGTINARYDLLSQDKLFSFLMDADHCYITNPSGGSSDLTIKRNGGLVGSPSLQWMIINFNKPGKYKLTATHESGRIVTKIVDVVDPEPISFKYKGVMDNAWNVVTLKDMVYTNREYKKPSYNQGKETISLTFSLPKPGVKMYWQSSYYHSPIDITSTLRGSLTVRSYGDGWEDDGGWNDEDFSPAQLIILDGDITYIKQFEFYFTNE